MRRWVASPVRAPGFLIGASRALPSWGVLRAGACGVFLACGVLLAATSAPGVGAAQAAGAVTGKAGAGDTAAVARVGVPEALQSMARGEIHVVDVRRAGQRALGHIRGDLHIPLDQIRARHGELPRDRRLVFYCSCHAEETALEAARVLIAAGDTSAAVLVGGYDAWRAAGGPFQVDATWEEIFRPDLPPVAWGRLPVDSVRCRYARDDSVAFRGGASARIGCLLDPAARGFAGLQQRADASRCAGRTVTMSAMVRAQGVFPGAFLWVGAEDGGGRMIGMTKSEPDSIRGTGDWRPVEVTWILPGAAARVVIGISLMGAGRVWLDEVRLVAPEGRALPRLRLVVENAGFED